MSVNTHGLTKFFHSYLTFKHFSSSENRGSELDIWTLHSDNLGSNLNSAIYQLYDLEQMI